MDAQETNRFNRLPESAYYLAVRDLFAAAGSRDFYRAYPFDVTPASDDHPFFYHFFKWGQTPQILAALGHTWQPFGGSGFFLLLAMLALVLILSGLLIVLPLLLPGRISAGQPGSASVSRWRIFLYFGLLGLAFLFVEIPLIQRWILLVGQPAYAFAAVVTVLLVFSGLGSLLAESPALPKRAAFGALVVLAALTPFLTGWLAHWTLAWPLPGRVAVAALSLAPLAMLMGLPFPLGLAWLHRAGAGSIPWAWAVNGCASVTAGVLAALLALSFGFTAVLLAGAACYAAAWITLDTSNLNPYPHAQPDPV